MLQENCYNETVRDVRGSVIWFSSGCHTTCTPAAESCTAVRCTACEVAQKFCSGGCSLSFT